MKNSVLFAAFSITLLITACNSGDDHSNHQNRKAPVTRADSLEKIIDEEHVIGMSKMAPLTKLQQRTKQLKDSLENLPAKAKKAAAPYKAKLDTLLSELDYAEFAMDKWMSEFYGKKDTLVNDLSQRVKYLETEKIKVEKLKQTIVGGIERADSLLRSRF